MKKSKTVKIKIDDKTEKEFTITELTVAQIIDLSQNNPLFGATLNDEEEKQSNTAKKVSEVQKDRGLMDEILDVSNSVKEVMKKACNFNAEDLKALAPSDVKVLYEAFLEVNETFLNLLEKMGIIEATKGIAKRAISSFLETLAI